MYVHLYVQKGVSVINYNCFVYCSEKDRWLKSSRSRLFVEFDECIKEIGLGKFQILRNKNPKYQTQFMFLVRINDYPFIVPFEHRGEFIRLITVFPDRRFKNV